MMASASPLKPSRTRRRRRLLLLLCLVLLPLILCGGGLTCVNAVKQGIYYGYITVDDPQMTFPKRINDTVTVPQRVSGTMNKEDMSITVVELRQEKQFFVVHIKMTLTEEHPLTSDEFLLYNNPTFDGEFSHHYHGTSLKENVTASSWRRQGDSDTEEGDLFYELPARPGHFVFVWIPHEEEGDEEVQYAWEYPEPPCTLFVFCP